MKTLVITWFNSGKLDIISSGWCFKVSGGYTFLIIWFLIPSYNIETVLLDHIVVVS